MPFATSDEARNAHARRAPRRAGEPNLRDALTNFVANQGSMRRLSANAQSHAGDSCCDTTRNVEIPPREDPAPSPRGFQTRELNLAKLQTNKLLWLDTTSHPSPRARARLPEPPPHRLSPQQSRPDAQSHQQELGKASSVRKLD